MWTWLIYGSLTVVLLCGGLYVWLLWRFASQNPMEPRTRW